MERIRIGNDIAISWALYENNGSIHTINAGGASVSLNCGGYTYPVPAFSVQGNVVSFIFPAEDQVKTGKYKIVLTERNESGLVSSCDVRDAFVLVPENEMLNVGYTQQKNVEITSVITHAAIANVKTISILESEEEGGDNIITFVLTDGSQFPMTVRNGSKGDKGDTGDTGPKGDKGDTGEQGPQGEPAVAIEEYVTVVADVQTTDVTDILPETGSADTLYRVACWDGTQYDVTVYSVYGWYDGAYKFLEKKDVGIDDEPTAGSQNLVKSGGVAAQISQLGQKVDEINTGLDANERRNIFAFPGSLTIPKNILAGTGELGTNANYYTSDFIRIKSGESVDYYLWANTTDLVLAFYNDEFTFVDGIVGGGTGSAYAVAGTWTAQADGYVRVSCYSSRITNEYAKCNLTFSIEGAEKSAIVKVSNDSTKEILSPIIKTDESNVIPLAKIVQMNLTTDGFSSTGLSNGLFHFKATSITRSRQKKLHADSVSPIVTLSAGVKYWATVLHISGNTTKFNYVVLGGPGTHIGLNKITELEFATDTTINVLYYYGEIGETFDDVYAIYIAKADEFNANYKGVVLAMEKESVSHPSLQNDAVAKNNIRDYSVSGQKKSNGEQSAGITEVRPYMMDEYVITKDTIDKRMDGESTSVFLMTDLHYYQEPTDSWKTLVNTFNTGAVLCREIPIDLSVMLGDYEVYFGADETFEMGVRNLELLNLWCEKFGIKTMAISGNHEAQFGGQSEHGFTLDEWYKFCQKKYVRKYGYKESSDIRVAYYDDEYAKIRHIFISVFSETYVADVDTALASVAGATPSGYSIIAYEHYGVRNTVTPIEVHSSVRSYIDTIKTAIAGLVNVDLVAWISGHTHIDYVMVYDSVPVVSLLHSASVASTYPSQDGNTYAKSFGTAREQVATVMTVRKDLGKLYFTRLGCGVDMEVNYNTTGGQTVGRVWNSLSGVVYDTDGTTPLSSVDVTISFPGADYTETTNASGEFSFSYLPNESGVLTADAEGKTFPTIPVDVSGTMTQNITAEVE